MKIPLTASIQLADGERFEFMGELATTELAELIFARGIPRNDAAQRWLAVVELPGRPEAVAEDASPDGSPDPEDIPPPGQPTVDPEDVPPAAPPQPEAERPPFGDVF